MATRSVQPVTQLLEAAGAGDAKASDDLLPLVYDELRRLAEQHMAAEPAGHTLQPTALVHEAYVRLVGGQELQWDSRGHFFAAAARAMRQILIDRARRRQAEKHGGGRVRLGLDQIDLASQDPPPDQLLALDEAIEKLGQVDERKVQIVMLRYFAGLTHEETASALGVSVPTVKKDWRFALAWLCSEMTRDG